MTHICSVTATLISRVIIFVTLANCLALSSSAHAAGKLYYGSRVGMTVTVISMQGLDTSIAVIKTRHTNEDAEEFCREYSALTPKDERWIGCVRDELATRLNDQVVANCKTGVFTNFYGDQRQYLGRNTRRTEVDGTKPASLIKDKASGRLLGDYSASGYDTDLQIVRALCPRSVAID